MAVYTTIDNPEAYFQAVLYTGDGAANNAITLPGDTNMQPDLVWIKNRDATDAHCLFDAVRGATEVLHPNTTAAEATDADTLDSFTSDGFQVDADVKVNTNTEKYVAWCWKESATSGFDIVSYTGDDTARTISHSLSAVPHMMIVKARSATYGWAVYHAGNTSAPETETIWLNSTDATADRTPEWNDTAPTSSVFTLGDGESVNKDTITFIAYLFSEKQGFSKFGSFTGNQSTNGPFLYTGFRPALLICKQTTSVKNWFIKDNKRLASFNPANGHLYPNQTHVGEDYADFDFLSNGIKIRHDGTDVNESGETYIYAAFAESPFVNSNGVPNNAR